MKQTIGMWVLAAGLVVGTATAGNAQPAVGPATVYTANSGGADVSALDAGTLAPVDVAIPADTSPQAVAVSPDRMRVYSGNVATPIEGNSSVTVIDAATNAPLTTVDFDSGDGVSDLVVAPDNAKVYAALSGSNRIEVLDAVTFGFDEIGVTPMAVLPPDLRAIDIATDGTALFVLDVANATVVKAAPADGATLASAGVSASAKELKVSTDGATLIVVGDDAAQFFSTDTLAPVAGAFGTDLGAQVDVAVAGQRAYVLNQGLVAPSIAAARGGVIAEASIDVYVAATGAYVQSFMLGASPTVNGIAVLPDATRAFVVDDGDGTTGTVRAVDLATGTVGPSGSTGTAPRRVVVSAEPAQPPPPPPPNEEIPVVSYFLPRSIALKLRGAGKDTLVASGFYDDGGLAVSYTDPVTIDVGGFEKTFTLAAKGKGFGFKDASVRFAIVPNLKGSSRGRFRMRIAKTTLAGLVDPSAAVDFHFHATGLPDAVGKVTLTGGRYRLGKKRGALIEPPFFPAAAKMKLGGPDLDVLSFRGGFASNGQTPAQLDSVRFELGPTFARTITGFTRSGDTFKFSDQQGTTKFSIAIDFLRELVVVKAKHVELGALDGPTVDVVFDAGGGTIRNTVRLGTRGAARTY